MNSDGQPFFVLLHFFFYFGLMIACCARRSSIGSQFALFALALSFVIYYICIDIRKIWRKEKESRNCNILHRWKRRGMALYIYFFLLSIIAYWLAVKEEEEKKIFLPRNKIITHLWLLVIFSIVCCCFPFQLRTIAACDFFHCSFCSVRCFANKKKTGHVRRRSTARCCMSPEQNGFTIVTM